MSRKRRSQPYQIKGVDALFGDSSEDIVERPQTVSIQMISLPSRQPRRYFDPIKLDQLTESVKQHGILEPLLVRPLEEGTYELVAGERRYRAAKAAGLSDIPVVIRDFSETEALEVSLMENLQREDLNPVEETEGILDLLSLTLSLPRDEIISLLNRAANAKKRGQELTDNVIRQLESIERVFKLIGRISPESFRTNRLPLLNLPIDILDSLRRGELEYTKARMIGKLKDEDIRQQLLDQAVKNGLSLTEIRTQLSQLEASSGEVLYTEMLLKKRFNRVVKKIKQLGDWSDPAKQPQLESLLQDLETWVGNRANS